MGETAVGQQRSPAEIRRDIDATRSDLSSNIDQIEDRVSPSRVVERSQQRVRSRWNRTREAVMGSAEHGKQRMSQHGDAAGHQMEEAQESIERNVRGNPLAAGLIAFGVGALASSLLPSSRAEQRLASSMREAAEPVVRRELQQSGKEVGEHLADEAKQAAQETAQTAKDAAQSTVESAKDAAQSTGEHAKEAAQSTGEQAKGAAQQTKDAGSSSQQGGGAPPVSSGVEPPSRGSQTPPPITPPATPPGAFREPGMADPTPRPPTDPPTHGSNV